MPLPVSGTGVSHPELQAPAVRADGSSSCLVTLISKVCSCIQAVLNFLTCGCFSNSFKQEHPAPKTITPRLLEEKPFLPTPPSHQTNDSKPLHASRVEKQDSTQPRDPTLILPDSSDPWIPSLEPTGCPPPIESKEPTENKKSKTKFEAAVDGFLDNEDRYRFGLDLYNENQQQRLEIINSEIDWCARLQEGSRAPEFLIQLAQHVCNRPIRRSDNSKISCEMASKLLDAGVQLKKEELKSVLKGLLRYYSQERYELIRLFLEKRTSEVRECDPEQKLLSAFANIILAGDRPDIEPNTEMFEMFTMLLNTGLKLEGEALQSVLQSTIERPAEKHFTLARLLVEKRPDAVNECDPEHKLLALAATMLLTKPYAAIKHLNMLEMLLNTELKLEGKALQDFLFDAVRTSCDMSCDKSYKLVELFLKKRKDAVSECDPKQKLLAQAAKRVLGLPSNSSKERFVVNGRFNTFNMLGMLLDAGFQPERETLKNLLLKAFAHRSHADYAMLFSRLAKMGSEQLTRADPHGDLVSKVVEGMLRMTGEALEADEFEADELANRVLGPMKFCLIELLENGAVVPEYIQDKTLADWAKENGWEDVSNRLVSRSLSFLPQSRKDGGE